MSRVASVAYFGKAGNCSAARSALEEAAAQFQKGLGQLVLLPDSRKRQQQELEFWSALAAVLTIHKGFAAAETGQAYACAMQLWERLDAPMEFLRIPYGLSRHHMFRGEFAPALRLDEDLLHLSRRRGDSAALVLAH